MDMIAKKLLETDNEHREIVSSAIEPGQIRYLAAEKSIWRDDYYYQPPMVVVLAADGKIVDNIRVAQVYDDFILAGPGDLLLDEDRTGGAGSLFVECWNTYTLRASYLGTQTGTFSKPVLAAIEALEKDPSSQPSWAILPIPMKDNDPRIHFRELEVEVAYTFSARAAAELMLKIEVDEPVFINQTPTELKKVLTDMVPGIRFPDMAESVADILTSARFPDEMLPRAAADDTAKKVVGTRVTIDQGRVGGSRPSKQTCL